MNPEPRRTPVAGWIVWSIRVTVTAHLVSVLAQGVLAGMFITGDVDLLRLHSINGEVASGLATLQFVAAILLWRPGRGAGLADVAEPAAHPARGDAAHHRPAPRASTCTSRSRC